MNPSFLDEERPAPAGPSKLVRLLRLLGRCGKLLFTDVLRRKPKVRDETATPLARFVRGLCYRLLFIPTVLAVLVSILVVTATHPKPAPGMMDPVSQGVYYDPVELLSLDNTKLEGWLVPVMNAHRVIVEGTDILHKKSAAVVLVHDFAASRQQVLPLVAPLHEAGYVVLAINLRGRGPSAGIGSTFGLNEAQDVRAAVELLRRRTYVDPEAIAVLGIGTGASAALIAAEQDARIKVLILDHPVRQFQDVLSDRIGPRQPWLSWVRPLCKWTFEIAYRVDADDVNLSRFKFLLTQRPSLTLDEPGEFVSCVKAEHRKEIIAFLKKNLIAHNKAAVTTLLQKETVGHVDRPAPVELPGSTESWPPQRSATELLERSKATGW
jgi:pimeloyl-ACP methyl ester carboxylesterase